MYILRKNATHYYYSDAKDPWIKIFFCLYGDLMDKIIEGYGITPLYLIENVEILDLFQQFNETAKNSKTKDRDEQTAAVLYLSKFFKDFFII